MVAPVLTRVKPGLILASLLATGCVSAPISASPSPSSSPSTLAACPASTAPSTPQPLLRNLPAPDDLTFDKDGRLLFGDVKQGTVSALAPDGSVERIAGNLSIPEGLVVLEDGRILVAEQGRNRVMAIDPKTHAISLWRAFPNRTANEGVDGIGPVIPVQDPAQPQDVIIPDSPNGVVMRVTPDGKTASQIAGGMTRPVGAAVDAAGRILVADEGGVVWLLEPVRRRFATLPTPDDVVVGKDGHVFVNTLGDNTVYELDGKGALLGVQRGLQQPQGIALDGADNLYYTETTAGRIVRVIRTFSLATPRVTRVAPQTYVVCPSISRAAGFREPLILETGTSLRTAVLGRIEPGNDTSGALKIQTPDPEITIRVSGGGLSLSQRISLSL
jgi:sugar lactone lactonase YvrE